MNPTPEKSPEFGVYTISKDYINYLRKSQPCIADPEETNTYCGPVYRMDTSRGPVDYFVPIDVKEYAAKKVFLTTFHNGVLAGIMDFKIMIPCLPSNYKLDESRSNLTRFCKSEKEHIKSCAASIVAASSKER